MRADVDGQDFANTEETERVPANLADLFVAWLELWTPPKRLPLSQWAIENYILSTEYSAESGGFRPYGYQVEPLDCFTDPRVTDIVLMVGTQVLKTIFIMIAMAYVAIEDPGPTLVSQPSQDDAETFSKERLANMVKDLPGLKSRISEVKSRSSSNTVLYKEFPGGSWSIVGAGVARNAARRTIRYAFYDEINKYEPTKEGSFIELADRRTANYRARAKRVYCCSPTTPDGPISVKYRQSDMRQPWCKCQACGEWQLLVWAQVSWDKTLPVEDQPDGAYYKCAHCEARWNDAQRWKAADELKWIAQKPFRGIAGFGGLSHLHSQNYKLSQMVKLWLAVNAEKGVEAIESLRVFINTDLAEEWAEKGEAPEWERLYERSRKSYPLRMVPSGGLFITAGADVHKDRIEIYPYAWGRGKRSWCLDQVVLVGDTTRPEVWEQMTGYLSQTYPHESGIDMPIVRLAIDSGYATQEVYAWARKQGGGRVLVVKGTDHGTGIVGIPSAVDVNYAGKKIARGVKVWPVNVSALKSELYGWLGLQKPTDEALLDGGDFPPGYCHFPELEEEFFRQITAEQIVTKLVKGYRKQEWIKTRDRNEALDCRNYARAAASQYGIDRFNENHWLQLESLIVPRQVEAPVQQSAPVARPQVSNVQQSRPWRPRLGGF